MAFTIGRLQSECKIPILDSIQVNHTRAACFFAACFMEDMKRPCICSASQCVFTCQAACELLVNIAACFVYYRLEKFQPVLLPCFRFLTARVMASILVVNIVLFGHVCYLLLYIFRLFGAPDHVAQEWRAKSLLKRLKGVRLATARMPRKSAQRMIKRICFVRIRNSNL